MRARSTSTKIYGHVSHACTATESRAANLALGDCPQCLDDAELCLQGRCIVEETHHNLNHLGDGLLKLAVFL